MKTHKFLFLSDLNILEEKNLIFMKKKFSTSKTSKCFFFNFLTSKKTLFLTDLRKIGIFQSFTDQLSKNCDQNIIQSIREPAKTLELTSKKFSGSYR